LNKLGKGAPGDVTQQIGSLLPCGYKQDAFKHCMFEASKQTIRKFKTD